MVSPQVKREAAEMLEKKFDASERQICRVIQLPLSTKRYCKKKIENAKVVSRIKYWAEKRPRYGAPRIHAMLRRRDGILVNHKRTERLYYQILNLGLRRRPKKKRYRSEVRTPVAAPARPNQVWSMDFVSDQLSFGRRVRGLGVVDVFTKINKELEFDFSLSGFRVVHVLERICEREGKPEVITVDNGPEFICMALDKWAYEKGVKLQFNRPGKPTDNPFIESFNGKMRDEFLNMHWFRDLQDLREKAMDWRDEYNQDRPHSTLDMKTPMEFLKDWELTYAAGLTG